jgi:hypothetical protein
MLSRLAWEKDVTMSSQPDIEQLGINTIRTLAMASAVPSRLWLGGVASATRDKDLIRGLLGLDGRPWRHRACSWLMA